jgi:hypothetical protein
MNYPAFNQISTAHLSSMAPKDKVSDESLTNLLGGRKFGQRPTDGGTFDMTPPIPECNQDDLSELEEYCRKRGIVGVNFAGMSPKMALQMLKGKTESIYASTSTKKGILHG